MYTIVTYSFANIGMETPGSGEWRKASREIDPDFHPDPTKERDPVEDLLEKRSPEDAIAELEDKLDQNPDDAEARRQLNLIRNRLSDLLDRVNRRVQH